MTDVAAIVDPDIRDLNAAAEGAPQRTDPLTFVVKAVAVVPQLLIPLGFVSYGMFDDGLPSEMIFVALLALVALSLILLSAWLGWQRFTYTVGSSDIRVDSGILSRTARSVPYERIQDVSLEQKFLPRLLGLVAVKFETGAGGKDELSLTYLSEERGEALRELVRERRDDASDTTVSASDQVEGEGARAEPVTAQPETLFTMAPRRLVTFGLFEFSLAIFAVLGGMAQYADTALGIELWDPDLWSDWLSMPSGWFVGLGMAAQVISAVAGLVLLAVVGLATGLIRTILRDWEFRLEKTANGFRRRRGLLTRTDVVMPAHRVQAVKTATGLVRRRFGWHRLSFVSLAQDSGSASHVVAPFAQEEEIAPIIRAAGFSPASEGLDWQRRSASHRTISMIGAGIGLALVALALMVLTSSDSDVFGGRSYLVSLPLAAGAFLVVRQFYLWRFSRNAVDAEQIYRREGWLVPSTLVANRVKLQSAEIRRGPLARLLGYADLHLGLAGGTYKMEGLPLARARDLRRAVLASIAQTDFSRLNR
ncbi:PH domain-containing protein [Qipengyuania sp. CAU 1752]